MERLQVLIEGGEEVWNLIAFEMNGRLQGVVQVSWKCGILGDHVEEKLP